MAALPLLSPRQRDSPQPCPNGSGHRTGDFGDNGIAGEREKFPKHTCSNGPLVSRVVCRTA